MRFSRPSRRCVDRTPVLACVLLALVVGRSGGEEVVVKNDSLVDFGNAFIVGDFLPSEQASSWLTSPCEGSIVAVQIFWYSIDPGAQPVIHRNIWINEAGAFPTPGDVLAQLSAPTLTSRFLNEFRTIDEQGTPLNVPVAAGQTFVVSLEFEEPTHVQNGTPSVVRDVDGCQAGRNGLREISLGWLDFCTFLNGDLVIRAVVDCGAPTGACCMPSGQCEQGFSADACVAAGGAYQGDGVSCSSVQCPQPTEACCFGPGGCVDLTAEDCTTAGGFSAGPQTDCATHTCFVAGACCFPDGDCTDDTPAEICASAGGAAQGAGVACAEAACPQPQGACCFSMGTSVNCFQLDQIDCSVIPESNWAGPFTTCADGDMNGTADACECGLIGQDWDGDCDVDANDYAHFEGCRADAGSMAGPLCRCFDTDGDDDADLIDFARLQVAFTGPGDGCP